MSRDFPAKSGNKKLFEETKTIIAVNMLYIVNIIFKVFKRSLLHFQQYIFGPNIIHR